MAYLKSSSSCVLSNASIPFEKKNKYNEVYLRYYIWFLNNPVLYKKNNIQQDYLNIFIDINVL